MTLLMAGRQYFGDSVELPTLFIPESVCFAGSRFLGGKITAWPFCSHNFEFVSILEKITSGT